MRQQSAWRAPGSNRRASEPLTVNAHNPAIFRATVGYEYFLSKAKRAEERLKSLAALKAAAMVGCPF
jgi:hypothetical protein